MSRPVVLSALQPEFIAAPTPTELRACRLDALRTLLEQAAERGSQLALAPECFNTYGLPRELSLADAAEPIDGETISTARALARQCKTALVLPIDLLELDGRIWNCAVIIDYQGEIAGVYRKVHPTRAELQAGRSAGSEFPVFDLAVAPGRTVRTGVMICHDNSLVESARCLALAGAELICWPHVQTGWGDIVWDITLRSRAIDNGVWLLTSCYAGPSDRGWIPGMLIGRSGIVGPDGFILAEMAREPGIATTTVDFDRPRLIHGWTEGEDHPFVDEMRRDRRPDAYHRITDPNA